MTLRGCLIVMAAAMLAMGCTDSGTEERTLLPADCELRPGDLVFRRGTGLTSHTVLIADNRGNYSHVGIVADSAGVMMVVHAVPGEPDYEGDPDRVKMEPPEKFFSSLNASLGEVCRPTDSVAGRRAAEAAMAFYHRRPLFDHQYDSQDTTKLYCTQLVIEAYRKAGVQLTGPPTHTFTLPCMSCICWLPSDIYQSDQLRSVMTFE